MELIFLTLLFTILGVYLWLRHRHRYWTRRGLPQADTCLLFGNLLDALLARKNQGEVYHDIYRQFPDRHAVGFYELTTPMLMVRTPALIQRVMVSDFSSFNDNGVHEHEPYLQLHPFFKVGEHWKNARSTLTPAMSMSRMKDMYQLMLQTVPLLLEYIDDHVDAEMEAFGLTSLYVMTNASNSVFGVADNCFKDANSHFRKMAETLAKEYTQNRFSALVLFYLATFKDLLRIGLIPRSIIRHVENMIRQVAEVRQLNNTRRNDFLQHFLDQKKPREDIMFEVISHGLTFFAAGQETSTIPAGYALYELAMNQEVQDKLHSELWRAFQNKDQLDFETLMNLPYLNKIVQETMRKYPIVFSFKKNCTKPTQLEIEGCQMEIEVGTEVIIPIFSICRDPQYYSEPEVFDPERFDETITDRTPFTYLPFGAGPRICPGMNYGLAQVKLFLANVLYKYKVVPCWKSPSTLTWHKASFLIMPVEKLWLRFEKR